MKNKAKDKIIFFLIGLMLGIGIAVFSWNGVGKAAKELKDFNFTEAGRIAWLNIKEWAPRGRVTVEDFLSPVKAVSGKSFGKNGQLTFELFRNGTFLIDGESGYAWQKSDSYRDSAFIRSTNALPKTYKVSVVVGDIDYGLGKIKGLGQDPEYSEGPANENGCYLLAITDTVPTGHHTNTWWHRHRKVVIDVDNNVWGHGMPNPVFMIYFDKDNNLVSFDESTGQWRRDWRKAQTYDPKRWYRIEIEKTKKQYIMSILDESEKVLRRATIGIDKVWHADDDHEEYFVIGEPHENYYQGSMKIKEMTVSRN